MGFLGKLLQKENGNLKPVLIKAYSEDEIVPGDFTISSDGSLLAFVDKKTNTTNVLNITEGKRRELKKGETSLAFSSDGKWLASTPNVFQKDIIIWDTTTWEIVAKGQTESFGPHTAKLSSQGNKIAIGGWWDYIQLIDLQSFEVVSLRGHSGSLVQAPMGVRVKCVFSPDGQRLFSGGYDGQVIAWDISGQRSADNWSGKLIGKHSYDVSYIALSLDGLLLATSNPYGGDKIIRVWNTATHQMVTELDATDTCNLAFTDTGQLIAITESGLKVWCAKNWRILSTVALDTKSLEHKLSYGGKYLLMRRFDKRFEIWQLY